MTYGDYRDLERALQYDFEQEKKFTDILFNIIGIIVFIKARLFPLVGTTHKKEELVAFFVTFML
ncbi:MAG: hypothetical protein MJ206_03640 [Bacilli bacterium]|nr:hypothetical protein [Bacilli bacterium]